ncbi:Ig-like domain-containing protein [Paludisphaera soli]|uniref:Ig-like domain-containing protein n=1 Tax=Paludisphaera soli TaxID=2712865 RepID=UPI0013EA1980|nr:Ig-like domain-containing protein [Paludisphaera soli]
MQKINCPGCYCPTPGLCAAYTVRCCSPTNINPGAGVPVRIRASSGGAVVASGVTDSDGRATLCVPTSATRWVEADVPHFATFGASLPTGTVAQTLNVPGASLLPGWCCNAASFPCTPMGVRPRLYITDAFGTWSHPTVCQLDQIQAVTPGTANTGARTSLFVPCEVGTNPLPYLYSLAAIPGPLWRLRRTWGEAALVGGGWRYSGQNCGSDTTCMADATFGPIDCENFYWSGSLVQTAGALPDPVGGTVVVSG